MPLKLSGKMASEAYAEKRDLLVSYLQADLLTADQLNLVHDLLTRPLSLSRAIELSGAKITNFDPAIPQPLLDSIRADFPRLDGMYIYDYTDAPCGQLVNVNDLLARKIYTTFPIS